MGYYMAGFEVVGVDIEPQPNYPFEFYQADALDFPLEGVDVIHASPPCQRFSKLAAMHPSRWYVDLITPMRRRLLDWGGLYVIENVEGAPLYDPVRLCGSMFGLGVERGYLRRHRLFESTAALGPPPPCNHYGRAVGVYGHGGHSEKHRMLYRAEAAEAMEIHWMTRDEMTQALPPTYTEWLGRQLIE